MTGQSKLAPLPFSTMSDFTVEIVTVPPEGKYFTQEYPFRGKWYPLRLYVVKQVKGCPKVLVFSLDGPVPCEPALFCDHVKNIVEDFLPIHYHKDGTRVTRSEFKRRRLVIKKRLIKKIPIPEDKKRKNIDRLTEERFPSVNNKKYH